MRGHEIVSCVVHVQDQWKKEFVNDVLMGLNWRHSWVLFAISHLRVPTEKVAMFCLWRGVRYHCIIIPSMNNVSSTFHKQYWFDDIRVAWKISELSSFFLIYLALEQVHSIFAFVSIFCLRLPIFVVFFCFMWNMKWKCFFIMKNNTSPFSFGVPPEKKRAKEERKIDG